MMGFTPTGPLSAAASSASADQLAQLEPGVQRSTKMFVSTRITARRLEGASIRLTARHLHEPVGGQARIPGGAPEACNQLRAPFPTLPLHDLDPIPLIHEGYRSSWLPPELARESL